MTIFLRLSLYVLGLDSQPMLTRLALSLNNGTSATSIVAAVTEKVRDRLHASLEDAAARLCLCIQNKDGHYIYLPSDDLVPLVQQQFISDLVKTKFTPPNAYLSGALIPYVDLVKANPGSLVRGATVRLPLSYTLDYSVDGSDQGIAASGALPREEARGALGVQVQWANSPPPTTRHVLGDSVYQYTPFATPSSDLFAPPTPQNNTNTPIWNSVQTASPDGGALSPTDGGSTQESTYWSQRTSLTAVGRASHRGDPRVLPVHYVDPVGRSYVLPVPRGDVFSSSVGLPEADGLLGTPESIVGAGREGVEKALSMACRELSTITGVVFTPTNMQLLCKSTMEGTLSTLKTDKQLLATLAHPDRCLYLAPNTNIFSTPRRSRDVRQADRCAQDESSAAPSSTSSSPKTSAPPPAEDWESASTRRQSAVQARLTGLDEAATQRSTRNQPPSMDVDLSRVPELPRYLGSTAATVQHLSSLTPPRFSQRDRNSALRGQGHGRSPSRAVAADIEEEDDARLSLAASHVRYAEAMKRLRAAQRDAIAESDVVGGERHGTAVGHGSNSSKTAHRIWELQRQQQMLNEELAECVSVERDCERLEMMIDYFQKEVEERRERQRRFVKTAHVAELA